MKNSSRPLLSKKGMQKKIDKGPGTVQRWVRQGILPRPFYIAGKPYWYEDEVDRHTIAPAVAARDAGIAA